MSNLPTPTVFISYSHDNDAHKHKVLALAKKLKSNGVKVLFDQWINGSPAKGWPLWMLDCLDEADFVLVVCTPTYYQRARLQSPPEVGKGVKWEAMLSANDVYNKDSFNTKLIPVFISEQVDEQISKVVPEWLNGMTRYTLDKDYIALYRHITGHPEHEEPPLGEPLDLQQQNDMTTPNIDISALPVSHSTIVGRDSELVLLNQAWQDPQCKVMTVIAWGGVGKTSLINHWANHMEANNWFGAAQVFAHSFYSQGSSDQRNVSADYFIESAFNFLDYNGPMPESGHEKGRLLAKLFCKTRTLVILDGLEPMQHPPATLKGKLKDASLEIFIKQLGSNINGLCVITSRVPVLELSNKPKNHVIQHELKSLSEKDGIEVLKNFKVTGPKTELVDAVNQVHGHALTLTLLGGYLSVACNGDIRKRDTIPNLVDEPQEGEHAKHVMQSYQVWLAKSQYPEDLHLLYIIALFDRPVEMTTVKALLKADVINGVTDKLKGVSDAKFKFAIDRLQQLKLIISNQTNSGSLNSLDCHPLVREHFANTLANQNPAGYQQAHSHLYEYYKNLPATQFPNTLEEMQPLFNAISHGCKAGEYLQALDDVYWPRVLRENIGFINYKLGAYGANLACIADFFIDDTWSKPADSLPKPDQAFMLNEAAFALRALGRLNEALIPFIKGLDITTTQQSWKNAAIAASSVSELYLALGQVKQAVDYGKRCVEYAENSDGKSWQMASLTTYADALLQRGKSTDITKARQLFNKAEQCQQAFDPEEPFLYSMGGYRYCQLLIKDIKPNDQQVIDKLIARVEVTVKVAKANNWLLAIALDELTLAKVYWLKQGLSQSQGKSQLQDFIDRAVDGLRKAGHIQYLPLGLLTRAQYHTETANHSLAWQDLDEVFEIASFGQMQLQMCDYHLQASRNIAVQLAQIQHNEACDGFIIIENGQQLHPTQDEMVERFNKHFATAEQMINDLPYHFRDDDLEQIRGLRVM